MNGLKELKGNQVLIRSIRYLCAHPGIRKLVSWDDASIPSALKDMVGLLSFPFSSVR
jgi:hypothetical protein